MLTHVRKMGPWGGGVVEGGGGGGGRSSNQVVRSDIILKDIRKLVKFITKHELDKVRTE